MLSREQNSQTGARGRSGSFALSLALAITCGIGAASAQAILPFSEVHQGMKGVGRTVFQGTRVDEFQVEVLGTMENVAPRRNMILVRLSGGPLENTGVMQGMSGSPVYIGDRLVGAVAYTWGFTKEPVAGLTPIQEMLQIEDKETPGPLSRVRSPFPPEAGPAGLGLLRDPSAIPAHFAGYFEAMRTGGGTTSLSPIQTPLIFTGFPEPVVESLAQGLIPAGLVAAQGGRSSQSDSPGAADIVPGASVGIKLIRGDLEVTAFCTVTHRDSSRVLACGHPLLNLGPTDLIMTTARVNALLPSLQMSFKLPTAGEEVGVFRQDRATGLFGYIGKKPRMIPVRVEIQPERGRSRRYAFDVVEDPFLAPYLLYGAFLGILNSDEKSFGEVSISYKQGSTIRINGEEDIALRNLFAGDLAMQYSSGIVAFIAQILMNNEYRPIHIEGINLILGYSDERRMARVERAWLSRDRARAGESVQVSVSLKPFRGPAVTRQIDIEVPDDVRPGRLLLRVGDGLAMARAESENEEFYPRDLAQLIWLVNHLRSNDTVYAVLTQTDNGILYQGERLPNLPPSIAQVMVRPRSRGNYLRLWQRGVAEEVLKTDYMVSGFKLLSLEVEE
jgi:hypothetical protein